MHYAKRAYLTQYARIRRKRRRTRSQNHGDLIPEGEDSGRKEGGVLSPELQDLAGKAVEYHEFALSENTRKAYQRGWEDFLQFRDEH